MHTRVQTNIESLLREPSGPRPLRRVVDIVISKPRIWSRGAKAISLENRPALQVTGSGRTAIVPLQPYCMLAFTSTHDCLRRWNPSTADIHIPGLTGHQSYSWTVWHSILIDLLRRSLDRRGFDQHSLFIVSLYVPPNPDRISLLLVAVSIKY